MTTTQTNNPAKDSDKLQADAEHHRANIPIDTKKMSVMPANGATWTPGLLKQDGEFLGTDSTDPQTIAYASDHRNKYSLRLEERIANAARLAACWNKLLAHRNLDAVVICKREIIESAIRILQHNCADKSEPAIALLKGLLS
jgi:hypothetical protein